ncbi:TIGR04283 family arsenosugar biosynthesis glycosyltransferase [Nitrospira sp. M1]
MTIGVIIPTLNEEATLSSTLSNLTQLHMDEVIIVDGGSQDRTREIAQTYLATHYPQTGQLLTTAKGRACQMNAGGLSAQSDIIIFLHADTRLPKEARQSIEEAMHSGEYVGGRFDVQFEMDRGYAWLISRMMNWRSRWSQIFTGDQAMFVRYTAFRQLKGFSDIPLMEDIEFSSRLRHVGPVISLRSKVTTSFRRWEQHGPLRTILHMWTLRFLYWIGVSPNTLHQFYGTVR